MVSVSNEEFRYLNKLGEARVEERLADKGFVQDGIVLAQPDDVLKQRIKDVSAFAEYISNLQDVCTRELSNAGDPANFDLVVLVRQGKQSKAWLTTAPDVIEPALSDKLHKQLEAVPPLDIEQGPVAFAIVGTIAGGVPDASRVVGFPTPKQWIEAAKGKGNLIIPDGFAPLVWPEVP